MPQCAGNPQILTASLAEAGAGRRSSLYQARRAKALSLHGATTMYRKSSYFNRNVHENLAFGPQCTRKPHLTAMYRKSPAPGKRALGCQGEAGGGESPENY